MRAKISINNSSNMEVRRVLPSASFEEDRGRMAGRKIFIDHLSHLCVEKKGKKKKKKKRVVWKRVLFV